MPPHPSASPQALPLHCGVHSHTYPGTEHDSVGSAQVPWHLPPQPSAAPQAFPSHFGSHTHSPNTHRKPAAHSGSQLHVGSHTPLTQKEPGSQVTSKQGLS